MVILFTFLLSLQNSFSYEWKNVESVVTTAIEQKVMPGGVLIVGQNNKIFVNKAYGVGVDGVNSTYTIYDIASLTKVVSTATSIMILEEKGELSLSDKLNKYLIEFTGGDKDLVTIEDLLRHQGGLSSGRSPLPAEAYEDYLKRIMTSPLEYVPRKKQSTRTQVLYC